MKERFQNFRQSLKRRLPFITIGVLVLLFLFVYMYNRIIVTIGSGEGGVLYLRFFGGTVIDRVYPEGIHAIFPWDTLYIYNVRVQQVSHEFDVLTHNGLKVNLLISIRYYPEYDLLGVLHKKVGPEYVHTVVIPEIEQVLRVLIGRLSAEEVYTTKQSIIQKSLSEAIEQIAQRFVTVDDVLIKRMRLPSAIENAIQDKLSQKHRADAYKYRLEKEKQEAERKRIEASGLKDYNKIVDMSLSNPVLQWMAIKASLELSKSQNTKVVVVGSGKGGLPIFGSLLLDAPWDGAEYHDVAGLTDTKLMSMPEDDTEPVSKPEDGEGSDTEKKE
ncbi:prohibitin family protein [Desulfococcaceae bacterium HSG8]|nr:prohibitin family protein [Desulfococcaceae bacterium HSG8]